jgi:hypothetical protein
VAISRSFESLFGLFYPGFVEVIRNQSPLVWRQVAEDIRSRRRRSKSFRALAAWLAMADSALNWFIAMDDVRLARTPWATPSPSACHVASQQHLNSFLAQHYTFSMMPRSSPRMAVCWVGRDVLVD